MPLDGVAGRLGGERTGSGPPLLLVHGTGEDHRRWAGVAAALSGTHTVYAVDRRGRGASADDGPYCLAAEAADLAAAAARLSGPHRPGIVAHSYGAICALEAAAGCAAIGPLVLFEPPVPTAAAPGTSPAVAARIRDRAAAGDGGEALALFLRDVVGIPARHVGLLRRAPGFDARAGAVAGTLAREIEATRQYAPDPSRLARVRGPVLLLAGEHSPAAIHAGVAAVHAALPDSRRRVLDGHAHHAIDTAPDAFVREVRAFLGGTA